MNEQLQYDADHLQLILQQTQEQALAYLGQLNERATSVNPIVPSHTVLNEEGMGTHSALALFADSFEPIMVASSGPRYWGFVTGGTTPASIAGDWLTSVYDQNTQATKGQGDVSALIERDTIQLLLELFGLPADFIGGFVTGATMSNFTCLAVARQWLGKQSGKDFAKEGVSGNIRILTAVPHSSAVKSLSMLGIGSSRFEQLPITPGNRETIDIDALEKRIEELNGEPFILISSAGTVNTVDFDNFEAIAALRKKGNFWWHIDGAFGAFAACSPAYRHLLKGWEDADSITVDCHKWLNVPYESAVFLVKEQHKILQTETFQNSNAPYLGNPLDNFSYLNFLPENSRRLKALPAWFTLRAYGRKGYRFIVENAIAMAQQFGTSIEQSAKFELLAPVRLNNVCFTLAGDDRQAQVQDFLIRLNATGKVFMTPTVYNGKKGIRAAFVNWRTTEKDLAIVMEEMNRIVNEL